MSKKKPDGQHNEPQERELPPGVKLFRTLEGHKSFVFSIAFEPSGETLASGSNDGTVKLWDVSSGKLLRTLKGQGGNVLSVAFEPSGRR